MSFADEAPEYELVVAGTLGPLLRNALAPYATAKHEVRAVVRAGSGSENGDPDLLEVLILLEARGIAVSRIQRLH